MFDISRLSDREILDYQYDYLINHCIQDIDSFACNIETKDKGLLACELYTLILKYNPNY